MGGVPMKVSQSRFFMGRGIGIRGHMVFGRASAPVVLEVRIYKMKFVVGDTEVSDFSEDLEVNCAP
jgi:hypothetical protein